MKISKLTKDKLLEIKWFSSIGEKVDFTDMILANSLNETGEFLAAPEWENVTLEESNEMSAYLADKFTDAYQHWNDVAKEAKLFFENDLKGKIPHLNDIDNTLLVQCVEWDVTHYLIEDFYKEKLKKPLFFYKLLSIYECGHIPCGWLGEWPNGRLVVY
ncbi:hypothetical protein [Shewanella chilikensis]|uniref:hypothetical protein n=1 Tax=Shewanella chilikensis TaxID=558541 RepID=UPI00399B607A